MITIQNSIRQFSFLLRITLSVALLLSGLMFASSAQATLIGLTPKDPDINISDIIFDKTGGLLDATTPGSFSATATGTFYLSPNFDKINGTFSLYYNVTNHLNQLLINGVFGSFTGTLLKGDIIKAGDNGKDNMFDFLIRVTELDSSLATAGFGPIAGVNFSDMHSSNGNFLVSDTFNVPVPEPATVILLAAGLAGLVAVRRRLS